MLAVILALILGYCAGAFAMFYYIRLIQIKYAVIEECDVGKNTWDVLMERLKRLENR